MATEPARRITRDDLEAKLREVRGEVDETTQAAKGTGMVVAGVAAVVIIGLVFLLGKRRGRRQTTTVEIRRV